MPQDHDRRLRLARPPPVMRALAAVLLAVLLCCSPALLRRAALVPRSRCSAPACGRPGSRRCASRTCGLGPTSLELARPASSARRPSHRLARLRIRYRLRDLVRGRVASVEIEGLGCAAAWSTAGSSWRGSSRRATAPKEPGSACRSGPSKSCCARRRSRSRRRGASSCAACRPSCGRSGRRRVPARGERRRAGRRRRRAARRPRPARPGSPLDRTPTPERRRARTAACSSRPTDFALPDLPRASTAAASSRSRRRRPARCPRSRRGELRVAALAAALGTAARAAAAALAISAGAMPGRPLTGELASSRTRASASSSTARSCSRPAAATVARISTASLAPTGPAD